MIDKFRTVLASKLPPGSFIRNVVTLMTGTTFAQALMILVAPILTRLYSPEDFGIYALYTSILGIIAVVSCWRYELAIVLPEKDEDAANLLVLSICICFGMAVLTLILVALFRNPLATLFGAPELAPWLWFMPLSLIAAGLFQAFNYWSTRRRQFRRLAIRQITQSTITAATQLGAGVTMNPGPAGLISGSIIGQTVATLRLAYATFKEESSTIRQSSLNSIKREARKYRKFPQYSLPTGLLNTASQQMPGILIPLFFSATVLGHYYLAQRVFSAPMGVIGQAYTQAVYPRMAECFNSGNDLRAYVRQMYGQLFKIVVLPAIVLTIFAPSLFAFIFGEPWRVSGIYLRYLIPWLTIMFIISPSTNVFSILNKQEFVLTYEVVLFLARLGAFIIGGLLLKNFYYTVAIFGLIGLLANIYLYFKIDSLLKGVAHS